MGGVVCFGTKIHLLRCHIIIFHFWILCMHEKETKKSPTTFYVRWYSTKTMKGVIFWWGAEEIWRERENVQWNFFNCTLLTTMHESRIYRILGNVEKKKMEIQILNHVSFSDDWTKIYLFFQMEHKTSAANVKCITIARIYIHSDSSHVCYSHLNIIILFKNLKPMREFRMQWTIVEHREWRFKQNGLYRQNTEHRTPALIYSPLHF